MRVRCFKLAYEFVVCLFLMCYHLRLPVFVVLRHHAIFSVAFVTKNV